MRSCNKSEILECDMFRLDIQDHKDHEINISGDKILVKELFDSICSDVWTHNFQDYDYIFNDGRNISEHASFNIGIWNFKTLINECSVVSIILNFVDKKNINLHKNTQNMLQYWDFEVKMIREGKSYRSKFRCPTSAQLTSPEKIETILNRCNKMSFSPSPELIFFLFENSDAMKNNSSYCQPLLPYEYEIQKFASLPKRNFMEIRKAARLIAQGSRSDSSLFFKLPKEINLKIASYAGNTLVHNEKESIENAIKHFGKPEKPEIQFVIKNEDTLLCYFPNGDVKFYNEKPSLIKRQKQTSDTCWFDGSMMLANLLMEDLSHLPELKYIKRCKEETGALYMLKYCYEQLVNQFKADKLELLCNHPDILSINFPQDFIARLGAAINYSTTRQNLLFMHLKIAITHGKEYGIKSLNKCINVTAFNEKYACLQNIGCGSTAKNIKSINKNLGCDLKYSDIVQFLLKESIVEKLFNILTIEKCQLPETTEQMYNLLAHSGPMLVKANFGIDCYKPGTEKRLRTIQNVQIYGWDKENYISEASSLHALIIVGMKYDSKNPEKSRIYFMDPRQTLDPRQPYQQTYSVGFKKFMSKVTELHVLKGYNLSLEHREILEGKDSLMQINQESNHIRRNKF